MNTQSPTSVIPNLGSKSALSTRLLLRGLIMVWVVAVPLVFATMACGGSLEPPGPPAPTMHSLDEIHGALPASGTIHFEFLGTTTPIAADSGPLGMARKC